MPERRQLISVSEILLMVNTKIQQAITLSQKHSPRDGELLYSFRDGDSSLVNRAVVNARQAFEDGRWCELPAQQRKSVLQKLADLIEVHKEEFALYESLDVGKTDC